MFFVTEAEQVEKGISKLIISPWVHEHTPALAQNKGIGMLVDLSRLDRADSFNFLPSMRTSRITDRVSCSTWESSEELG